MKKVGLFAVLASCLMLIAGCGVAEKKHLSVDEFLTIEGHTYDSYKDIYEKYGAFSVIAYLGTEAVDDNLYKCLYVNEDCTILLDNGFSFLLNGNDYYSVILEEGNIEFINILGCDNTTFADTANSKINEGVYDFFSDENQVISKTKDGYLYQSSCITELPSNVEAKSVYDIIINDDYSINSILSNTVCSDGREFNYLTNLEYSEISSVLSDAFMQKVKEHDGKFNHYTINVVRDGEIVKTYEKDARKGFNIAVELTEEYDNPEGNICYLDKELTVLAEVSVLDTDTALYVRGLK